MFFIVLPPQTLYPDFPGKGFNLLKTRLIFYTARNRTIKKSYVNKNLTRNPAFSQAEIIRIHQPQTAGQLGKRGLQKKI